MAKCGREGVGCGLGAASAPSQSLQRASRDVSTVRRPSNSSCPMAGANRERADSNTSRAAGGNCAKARLNGSGSVEDWPTEDQVPPLPTGVFGGGGGLRRASSLV